MFNTNFNANKGYIGYSESIRSREAKSNDYYPISLWTKDKMIEVLEEEDREDLIEKLKKIPVYILKEECLRWEEWHHTSKFYNPTDFYSFSINYLEDLTDEDIERARERRRKENLRNKEAREEKKRLREKRKIEKEELEHKLSLMKYTKYKMSCYYLKALEDGRIKLEDLEKMKREEEKAYKLKYMKYTKYKREWAYLKALDDGRIKLEDLIKLEQEEYEERNFPNRYNSILGNLRKYTHYKKFKDFKKDVINGNFDFEELKKVDDNSIEWSLYFAIEYLEKFRQIEKNRSL